MPYTPPSQQSPAPSKHSTPALSRSPSYSEDGPRLSTVGRPTPPRSMSSTSYLHKHRRSPSIKSDGAPPTPTEGPEAAVEVNDFAPNGSALESPMPMNHHVIPQGGMPSPPDSSENSDGDEQNPAARGRELANNWTELQAAVRGISQKRESSPEKTRVAHTGTASEPVSQISSPTALSEEARKISHSRSATDIYIPSSRNTSFESPIQVSDESDEENALYTRPSLIRKKSGELVKPALRPSSRRRYSSMPGTPTYSKTVHFNDSDNQTRHFLQVDKPIAVSAGTSPVETAYESESEYPFDGEKKERQIKLSNFPVDTMERLNKPIRVERIFLSSDKNTLIGVCAVQNIDFHKSVVARFTLDYWKTTSEVLAEYNNDPKNKPADGCDRFNFNIKLSDHKNIEDKTLLLCVRYNVSGQEFWDNNTNTNYQIDFAKVAPAAPAPQPMSIGLGARPLHAIPRSRHTAPGASRGRQESLDDDFAVRVDHRASAFSLGSPDNLLGEPPNSIKLKSRAKRGSLFPTAADSSASNGLGGRYDFGASLSAALTQAQEKMTRQNAATSEREKLNAANAASNAARLGPIERKDGPVKNEERPDAITTDRPAMGSDQYKDLVQKFCYFTPGAGKQASSPTPPPPEPAPSSNAAKELTIASTAAPQTTAPQMQSTDGAMDDADDSASTSATNSGTSSPLMMSNNSASHGEQHNAAASQSPARSPFASRSASPGPVTGGGMGGRAASPISFGYPYHATSRDGYLSGSTTPTAIQT